MIHASVILGQVVEIRPGEAEVLRICAERMLEAAESRHTGWFTDYLRAHSDAANVFRVIFERSHASSKPERV